MKMDAWIQSADYSIVEHFGISADTAIEIFQNHHWVAEGELAYTLGTSRADFCSAGFGLKHPNEHQLWLLPKIQAGDYFQDSKCDIFCTLSKAPKSILGFLTIPIKLEYESDEITRKAAQDFIRQFFCDTPHDSPAYANLPFRLSWSDLFG